MQVPTTLMAQVDSAIGGKVGVNHPRGKNLIGAFHAPRAGAWSTPTPLATLPRREFRAGLYEVIKYGVIASEPLLDLLERRLDDVLTQRGEALAEIVGSLLPHQGGDRRRPTSARRGLRRVLNFGHTAGHALEAMTRLRPAAPRRGRRARHARRARARRGAAASRPPHSPAGSPALLDRLGPVPSVAELRPATSSTRPRRDKKVVDRHAAFHRRDRRRRDHHR